MQNTSNGKMLLPFLSCSRDNQQGEGGKNTSTPTLGLILLTLIQYANNIYLLIWLRLRVLAIFSFSRF